MGRLEVDHKLELDWSLDRWLGGAWRALENLRNNIGHLVADGAKRRAATTSAKRQRKSWAKQKGVPKAAPLLQLSRAVGARVRSTYGSSRTRSRQEIDRYDVGYVVDRSKVEGRVAGQHRSDAERAALASINVVLPYELA